MVSGTAILILYIRQALSIYSQHGRDILYNTALWARSMLVYIAIGVIAIILSMIVLHILLAVSITAGRHLDNRSAKRHEDTEDYFDPEDEMDRLIDLKAGKIGYAVVGIGFVAGLVSAALGAAPAIMMNMVFLSFLLGNLLEGTVKIYFYRRGVSNG